MSGTDDTASEQQPQSLDTNSAITPTLMDTQYFIPVRQALSQTPVSPALVPPDAPPLYPNPNYNHHHHHPTVHEQHIIISDFSELVGVLQPETALEREVIIGELVREVQQQQQLNEQLSPEDPVEQQSTPGSSKRDSIVAYAKYDRRDIMRYRRKWKFFRVSRAVINVSYVVLTLVAFVIEALVATIGIGVYNYHRTRFLKGEILGCRPHAILSLAFACSIMLALASATGFIMALNRIVLLTAESLSICGSRSPKHQQQKQREGKEGKAARAQNRDTSPFKRFTFVAKVLLTVRCVFIACFIILLTTMVLLLYIPKNNCSSVAPQLTTDITIFMYVSLGSGVACGIVCLAIAVTDSIVAICCVPAIPKPTKMISPARLQREAAAEAAAENGSGEVGSQQDGSSGSKHKRTCSIIVAPIRASDLSATTALTPELVHEISSDA